MPAPLSIIIPALNAEADLKLCLQALLPGLEAQLIREVILVDGGSEDQTRRIADSTGATILTALEKGRGAQLKYGAEHARGDWLLFIHADTVLTRDWAERVHDHIGAHSDKAAAFELAFRSDHPMAKKVAARANWRARKLGLPYGDQGLLLSRKLYQDAGGYKALPLMEDVDLVQRLGKARIRLLSAQARTSAEKYETRGWRRRSLSNIWRMLRYKLGASPEKLAKTYN